MNLIQDFMYTVKSDRTKTTYKEYLKYFETYSKISVTKLLTMKPKDIENILIKYVKSMRDKNLSNSSIKGRIAPLITILELNSKLVNKRKIKKYYGGEKKTVKDFAYTTEDIAKLLSVAKLRSKVMILIYTSAGIRRDAIIDLKLKHLEKIEEYGLYKFTIYENSNEEYTTYCTPECANMIDLYLKHREQSGEVINKESYLIRNDFNYTRKDMSRNAKPITSVDLSTLFRNLLLKTGLRAENQRMYGRHNKALFHAHRKRFATILANSKVDYLHKELLLGHKVGLDESYYRGTEEDLLNQYVRALDKLTINEEYKLKKDILELQKEKSQMELLELKHEKEVKEMRQNYDKILSAISKDSRLAKIKPEVLKRKIK